MKPEVALLKLRRLYDRASKSDVDVWEFTWPDGEVSWFDLSEIEDWITALENFSLDDSEWWENHEWHIMLVSNFIWSKLK